MIQDYFLLAFGNLKRRGIRSWLTLLGIVIGIMAVVSLITLGDGLKSAINSQFEVDSKQAITVQASSGSIGMPGQGVIKPLTKDDVKAIKKLSVVDIVTPRNLESVRVEYNNKVTTGLIVSVEEGVEKDMYDSLGLKIGSGKLLSSGSLGGVAIGSNYADGKSNRLDRDISVGQSITIQGKKFRVVGIIEKKGSFLIDNLILMYDNDLNKIKDIGDRVDIIGIKVKDPSLMDKAKEDIEKLLRKRRNVKEGQEDFTVSTPDAILGTVSSVIDGVQIFIVIIAGISIFVGAIGITNTMATSVVERTKEIGIMKSIGAKNSDIFYQFFIESGMIGLVGGIIGVAMGLLIGMMGTIAINTFVESSAKLSVDYILIVFSLVGSFFLGSIAGIAPAMNAAKMNPVEALRK